MLYRFAEEEAGRRKSEEEKLPLETGAADAKRISIDCKWEKLRNGFCSAPSTPTRARAVRFRYLFWMRRLIGQQFLGRGKQTPRSKRLTLTKKAFHAKVAFHEHRSAGSSLAQLNGAISDAGGKRALTFRRILSSSASFSSQEWSKWMKQEKD